MEQPTLSKVWFRAPSVGSYPIHYVVVKQSNTRLPGTNPLICLHEPTQKGLVPAINLNSGSPASPRIVRVPVDARIMIVPADAVACRAYRDPGARNHS